MPDRHFDFRISATGGLVTMAMAALLLDRPLKVIHEWIELGRIRWAFDLRREKAIQREVRILRGSLLECAGLVEPVKQDARSDEEDFKGCVESLIPAGFQLNPITVSACDRLLREWTRNHQLVEKPLEGLQKMLYPADPVILGTEVASYLSCSPDHVGRLVSGGCLKAASVRRGPRATPLIFRASLVEFLKKRRLY